MRQAKPPAKSGEGGFSLIEVVLALGIAVFVLLSIMVLLPIGISTNKISTEELHASNLLSLLYADLRNTDPRLNQTLAGTSLLFGLMLPYQVAISGKLALNTTLVPVTSGTGSLATGYTSGVDNSDSPVAVGTIPPLPYQVSVVYAVVPASGSAPIQVRLIVNWPCLNGATVANLTDRTKVRGYVEACVTYPAP